MEVQARNEDLSGEERMRAGRSESILLLGVCDDVALQVVALHQRFVVEVGYTCVFDVATHIKYLIGGSAVSEDFGWDKQDY